MLLSKYVHDDIFISVGYARVVNKPEDGKRGVNILFFIIKIRSRYTYNIKFITGLSNI